VRAIDAEQSEIGDRDDRGRSGLPVEQAHLAKKVTGLELAAGSHRRPHRGHAVDDDEERITRVANARDHGPLRHLDDLGELGDPSQLVLVEPAEQRHPLQMPSLRVAGKHRLARVGHVRLFRIMKGKAIRRSWIELHRLSSAPGFGRIIDSTRHRLDASPAWPPPRPGRLPLPLDTDRPRADSRLDRATRLASTPDRAS